jgi:hypothetical protein
MDGELYLSILKEELQESIQFYDFEPSRTIFQQDNDLKHTCISKKAQSLKGIVMDEQLLQAIVKYLKAI